MLNIISFIVYILFRYNIYSLEKMLSWSISLPTPSLWSLNFYPSSGRIILWKLFTTRFVPRRIMLKTTRFVPRRIMVKTTRFLHRPIMLKTTRFLPMWIMVKTTRFVPTRFSGRTNKERTDERTNERTDGRTDNGQRTPDGRTEKLQAFPIYEYISNRT